MSKANILDKDSKNFIRGIKADDAAIVRSVPKSELHSHGNLAFHLYEINRQLGLEIPPPEDRYKSFDDFMEYIRTHLHPLTDSQHELEYILRHAVEMSIIDGVTILEMSIDVKFSELWPDMQHFIDYVQYLVDHFARKVDFRPELGLNRGDSFQQLVSWAIPCIESGVFKSIDLYGDERDGDLHKISDIFKTARAYGLKLKAHSGEYGTSEQMLEAIDLLGLDAIQHGINAVDHPDLMKRLKEENIVLNICPTSNIVLCRVPSMAEHPIKELFHAGIPVTINSDDIAVFDQTVSQEYMNLFEADVFSAEELNEIRLIGLQQ